MSAESDRLLVQQIRTGDTRAWQLLISRYEGRLYAYAERRLKDPSTCEDVVQDTFIGFLNSLPNYDERRELQTYLFSIVANKVTDVLRRNGRRPYQTGVDTDDALPQQIDHDQISASSAARGRERTELESTALARALAALLNGWREKGDFLRIQVLELLFVKGWANRDTARHLGISEQQVANIRFAAVRKLSEQMKAAGLPGDVFPELHADGS